MVDITSGVEAAVRRLGLSLGVVLVASPHTTAAITINEGFDPAVCDDLLAHLEALVPKSRRFTHAEGNSDAHIKVSLLGSSQMVMLSGGELLLGRWQRIFFCEFDGPRSRRYLIRSVAV
jgi:secondary thiamine-phosphate synthase enzyme